MTVLRGGLLVDGTGAPARPADVVVEGDRIVAVEAPGGVSAGSDAVDLDGLVLAPGFIDCHTHYDAQVLWDPDLTPSSWHGVTTVVMGNCGFGIAPTRPGGRETIARTLENVEGMSVAALFAGIPWTFESFPEYLDAVERTGPKLNEAERGGHARAHPAAAVRAGGGGRRAGRHPGRDRGNAAARRRGHRRGRDRLRVLAQFRACRSLGQARAQSARQRGGAVASRSKRLNRSVNA